MTAFQISLIVFLMLMLMAGLIRVIRGPTAADRMLAVMLLGTTGVAIATLLAPVMGSAALIDVALVFAVLSSVAMVAFARDTWTRVETNGASDATP